MSSLPCERKKLGWYGEYARSTTKAIKSQAKCVIIGDSIVYHLQRFPKVWKKLQALGTVNCGIRGDLLQNVMWRVERMRLPATTTVGIINCGINNIRGFSNSNFSSHEVARNLVSCGEKLAAHHPLMSIVIIGILPTEESFVGESLRIASVNKQLEVLCEQKNFQFINAHHKFKNGNELNSSLYWRDGLHLSKKGSTILSTIYASAIAALSPPPPPPSDDNDDDDNNDAPVIKNKIIKKIEKIEKCPYEHESPIATALPPPSQTRTKLSKKTKKKPKGNMLTPPPIIKVKRPLKVKTHKRKKRHIKEKEKLKRYQITIITRTIRDIYF